LACSQGRERKGRRQEQGGFSAVAAAAGEREEEEKEGGKGRPTGGPRLSAPRGKRKREGGAVGWRGGGLGRLGRKEPVQFFFFFLFQTSFSNHFHLKFKTNFFKLFSRIL
jgi:hypothetical protein